MNIRNTFASWCRAGLAALTLTACSDDNNNNRQNQMSLPNIVETAIMADDFALLVATLEATGLNTTLADEEQTFTVSAPTDAAFEALGEDTINALLADTDTLADILLYHVIGGQAVDSETAFSLVGSLVDMANGDAAPLLIEDGVLTIAGAQIVMTDIHATNGIIHVIDAVILPPS